MDANDRPVVVKQKTFPLSRLAAWLALLLSLLALGFSLVAFSRTSGDTAAEVQNSVNQGTDKAQDAAGTATDRAEDAAQGAGEAIDNSTDTPTTDRTVPPAQD